MNRDAAFKEYIKAIVKIKDLTNYGGEKPPPKGLLK
jgi:hypothetical protein